MTVILTPTCSKNSLVGIYYNEDRQMSSQNVIQATNSDIQTGPDACDPLQLVFSSNGPLEYFSVYNYGSEVATFSIVVEAPPAGEAPGGVQLWVILVSSIGGGVLLVGTIIVVFAVSRRRRASYTKYS